MLVKQHDKQLDVATIQKWVDWYNTYDCNSDGTFLIRDKKLRSKPHCLFDPYESVMTVVNTMVCAQAYYHISLKYDDLQEAASCTIDDLIINPDADWGLVFDAILKDARDIDDIRVIFVSTRFLYYEWFKNYSDIFINRVQNPCREFDGYLIIPMVTNSFDYNHTIELHFQGNQPIIRKCAIVKCGSINPTMKELLEKKYELTNNPGDFVPFNDIRMYLKNECAVNMSETSIGRELTKLNIPSINKKISHRVVAGRSGIRQRDDCYIKRTDYDVVLDKPLVFVNKSGMFYDIVIDGIKMNDICGGFQNHGDWCPDCHRNFRFQKLSKLSDYFTLYDPLSRYFTNESNLNRARTVLWSFGTHIDYDHDVVDSLRTFLNNFTCFTQQDRSYLNKCINYPVYSFKPSLQTIECVSSLFSEPTEKLPLTTHKTSLPSLSYNVSYIYLIQEREHLHANRPVYKFGRTSQAADHRIRRLECYKKGSMICGIWLCPDASRVVECEAAVLNAFLAKFTNHDDGREHFSGDLKTMKETIDAVVKKFW